MLETFNEVNDFIEKTLSDAGINPPDFKTMIEKAQEVPAENVETVMVTEEDLPVKTQEPQKAVVRNDVVKEASTETETVEEEQDAPEITIVKHDDSKETGTNSGNSENGSAETEVLPEKTESSLNTKSVRVDREPVNPAENFVKNLELAVEATEEIPENTPDIREIVYQVVDRIRVDISPENTSMEMRLNPENLGRVAINITSREGVMTAEIRTENRQAREAIESQLQILKDNIEAKGIRVEAVEVRISDFNFADSKNSENSSEEFENRNQGRARRNRGFSVGEEGIDTEAEKLENEVLISSGSTVSYRA
jgi:flagellar hook-length control protein FliK